MTDAADAPAATSRRVVFRRFGGPEVPEVECVPVPRPGPGQVLVRVAAAGINPVDWKLFSGRPMRDPYERELPSGNGYDFSGVVTEAGAGAVVEPGARVLGGLRFRAQADHLVIDALALAPVPDGLDLVRAGALNVTGRTSIAAVRSQGVDAGDAVLVSGASGGVGILAAQLCRLAGATVVGVASERSHDLLRRLGVLPVVGGDRLAGRVRDALGGQAPGVVLDCAGFGTVDAALELGVPLERINTIADYDARDRVGVPAVGGAAAGVAELAEAARLVADDALEVPIDSTFPLERAGDAYRRAMSRDAVGKVVLVTGRDAEVG